METNEVMSRQEEFNDIPDLGPASDELDRDDIPTLKPLSEVSPQQSRVAQSKSGNGAVYLLIVLLAVAVGGGAFLGLQKIEQLNQKLANTELALADTQGRLADIENLVSATDESVNKSGAALQAQLKQQLLEGKNRVKHVDSEIAKLWAIYQKYKPQIESLNTQQKSQEKQLSAHKTELKTVGQSLDTIGLSMDTQRQSVEQAQKGIDALDKQLAAVNKKVQSGSKQLNSEVSKLSEQMRLQDLTNQEVDDLQAARMDDMQKSLNALKSNPQIPSSLRNQVQEQQKALNSINSYRRQINSELLKIRKRVSQLQVAVESAPAPKQ